MSVLFLAVGAMIIFCQFAKMSQGATFSVVPFVNRKALGPVIGIVGAGGNAGALAAGFLFRIEGLSTEQALLILGVGVAPVAPLAFMVRFSAADEAEEKNVMERALAGRAKAEGQAPAPAD